MKSMIESNVERIPVDKILPNPNQPRKHFDDAAINELAESIKSYGIIQPIQVRRISDEFYE
ncbi:MAG: ParB N-terminal domain-containing protein, partial [Eubacterium sp.]